METAPRTCGDCSIIDSFYWKAFCSEKKIDVTQQPYAEMLERMLNEPWSLIELAVDKDGKGAAI